MCKNEEMLVLLSGHIDGFNLPEEEARLEAHLAQCPDCRRTLEEYQKNDAGIAGFESNLPADFTRRVMQAVNAEPRRTETKKPRRWSFGFATAAAAVAAVFLLAFGSGKLPHLNAGSARVNDVPMGSSKMAAAEQAMPEPEAAPESIDAPEAMLAPNAPAPDMAFSEEAQVGRYPANVDCEALANDENCSVGLLYADPAGIPELEGAPSLPLNGGVRYEVTQKTLDALAERFGDLQIFTPEDYLPKAEAPAYLIVVQ